VTTAQTAQRAPLSVYLFLVMGVLAASSAAILITYALREDVPPSVIAAGRLTLAALALTPFAVLGGRGRADTPLSYRDEIRRLTRRDLLLAGGAGVMLGLHFATWIASLAQTSVLISVVLVSTGPLWVGLLEFLFLRLVPRRLVVIGLLLAIGGGLVIGLSGGAQNGGADGGALLALAGAVSVAIYLVIGRGVRAKLSLVPYIWMIYGVAALVLIALMLLGGDSPFGYPAMGYIWIVLLAIFPQMIGHTSFNNALRYLSATYVSIATQLEPIGSAIAAAILFAQLPNELQIIGSACILSGVLLATWGQRT
jgi:drug/metabolite transporter (DMT)-like permease